MPLSVTFLLPEDRPFPPRNNFLRIECVVFRGENCRIFFRSGFVGGGSETSYSSLVLGHDTVHEFGTPNRIFIPALQCIAVHSTSAPYLPSRGASFWDNFRLFVQVPLSCERRAASPLSLSREGRRGDDKFCRFSIFLLFGAASCEWKDGKGERSGERREEGGGLVRRRCSRSFSPPSNRRT